MRTAAFALLILLTVQSVPVFASPQSQPPPKPQDFIMQNLSPYLSGSVVFALSTFSDKSSQSPTENPTTDRNPPSTQPVAPTSISPSLIQVASKTPFGRNVLLGDYAGQWRYHTEPSIAIDPKDPNHIIVAFVDYNTPSSIATYTSWNGGEAWIGPSLPRMPMIDTVGAGDPSVVFDVNGTACLSYIAMGLKVLPVVVPLQAVQITDIIVSRSTDGGLTWGNPIIASHSPFWTELKDKSHDGSTYGKLMATVADKPWITYGPSATNGSSGVLYLTYTAYTTVLSIICQVSCVIQDYGAYFQSSIRETSSVDGIKWGIPTDVASPIIYKEESPTIVQGSNPAVAPDGTLYVAYFNSNGSLLGGNGIIQVTASVDGGKTFEKPVNATTLIQSPYNPRTAYFRYWATEFPRMASGPQGQLAIAYGAPTNSTDDGNIYLITSSSGARKWSSPVQINQDKTNALQFFPSIAYDNDTIRVAWGGFDGDKSQRAYDLYYTTVSVNGTIAPQQRVSTVSSNPNFGFGSKNGIFIGDYFCMASRGSKSYFVWTDTRVGYYGITEMDIGFASTSKLPPPILAVTSDLKTVEGYEFQPNSVIYVSSDPLQTVQTRTDSGGSFSITFSRPTLGNITAIDITGNFASLFIIPEFAQPARQPIQDTPRSALTSTTVQVDTKQSYLIVMWFATAVLIMIVAYLAYLLSESKKIHAETSDKQ